ncbi:MAG TPA: L-ribulose-5-phosphate 3-epimerase, partial [Sphaerochaeta sp.]|nr:L-ribulose-5-phosphate 3-epimerase [Sphaerochaeta sp.]
MTNSYTLGLYEKSMPDTLFLGEKLRKAKSVGYSFLELSIDETKYRLDRLTYSARQLLELRNEVQETSFPLGSICLSAHRKFPLGSSDVKTREKSLDIMKRAIDFATYMGIPIIQLAGYDVYYETSTEKTKALFVENLHLCAQVAAEQGILLGFETMETPFMNTVTKALEYVHLVNSPYLQVYPDIGNIVNAVGASNKKAREDILSGKGHIIAAHIKETVPGKFREIPYGTGHVDFPLLLQACWDSGVRRFVTEFWHTGSEDWEKQLTDSYTYVNQVFFNKKKKHYN